VTVIDQIAAKVRAGERVSADEALELYRRAPTALLGRLADRVRASKHPDGIVTYIIDRNVNYTNVCVAKCNFCAFYRPVGSSEGYVLGFDELFRKIDETIAVGGVQLLLQGGHNPDLPLTWYEDLFRAIKQRYPTFKLHALSPPEVIHLSRLSQLPVPAVIDRLIAAGLDSIPGGGAEILVDRVRTLLHCCGCAISRTKPAASPPSSRGAISRITRSSPAPKRPASTTSARSPWPASCSTTSTTCRRHGSPRAARSDS
jgi:cyclic dehypoxanthinyl futalosine synthase